MGLPEPLEPEPKSEPVAEDPVGGETGDDAAKSRKPEWLERDERRDAPPPPKPEWLEREGGDKGSPQQQKPDWLVRSEDVHGQKDSGPAPEPLRLPVSRPDAGTGSGFKVSPHVEPEASRSTAPTLPAGGMPGRPPGPGVRAPGPAAGGRPPGPATGDPKSAVAWSAAASSIPRLRVVPAAVTRPPETDDAWADHAGAGAFPDDLAPPAPAPAGPVGPAPLPPLHESWWVVALDELRSNIRVQILVGLVLAGAAAALFWPRSEPSVSLSRIRRHVSEFDGRRVTLHGRVGEVFPVGSGYTFYLFQGRDTMVVFTRSRVPIERQTVAVKGTINTGYLDGVARQTLFEDSR